MLAAEARDQLVRAGTSGISDAMERLGLPRTAIVNFRTSMRDVPAVVGVALTIRQMPKNPTAPRQERLARHGEVVEQSAREGDFIVLDGGARADIASWGENHTRRCKDRGVAGILVNGSVRDIAAIRALAMQVFHLGTSPVSSRWDQRTAEIGGDVVVAGVTIRSGDILVGDEDGLVVVAPEQLKTILGALK